MCEVLPKTLKKFKEIVDTIYTLTVGEGYRGTFNKGTTARTRAVIAILKRRGVIVRDGHTKDPVYKWAAALAPTKNLYQSVAEEVVAQNRASAKRGYLKRKSNAPAQSPKPAAVEKKETPSLGIFSDEELWGELKARGYDIENNRLCRVTKIYLD